MNIFDDNIRGIKVTGNGKVPNPFRPQYMLREDICEQIIKSHLFTYIGKSRIDGFNLYTIDKLTIRRMKIDKIHNNTNTLNKLYNLMDDLKGKIVYLEELI